MNPSELIERAPPELVLPAAFAQAVIDAWSTPGRRYHSLAHLTHVLDLYAATAERTPWPRPREVFLALLFHDAVYEPGRTDNEERSAALARALIAAQLPEGGLDVGYVERLIRLTARHGQLGPGDVEPEAARFLDCDMAVLGGEWEDFAAYDAGVAAEYAHVQPELYAAGRSAFLESLLERPRIFLSAEFAGAEQRARDNIRRRLRSS